MPLPSVGKRLPGLVVAAASPLRVRQRKDGCMARAESMGLAAHLETRTGYPPRAGAFGRRRVAGVAKRAPRERQAAAAKATTEGVLEGLELRDPCAYLLMPPLAESVPVGLRQSPPGRQAREVGTDFVQAQAHPLPGRDEGQPAQHRPGVTALVPRRPLGNHQPALLVVAKRRHRHPSAGGNLPDGEHLTSSPREVVYCRYDRHRRVGRGPHAATCDRP